LRHKGKREGVKTSLYLPKDLLEKFRIIAWYERKNASELMRELMLTHVSRYKRIPRKP